MKILCVCVSVCMFLGKNGNEDKHTFSRIFGG